LNKIGNFSKIGINIGNMKTIENLIKNLTNIPVSTSWSLSDLNEFRGKQELYVKQSPQKLKKLKEHAVIESSIASNRLEGVHVDNSRIGTVIFGHSHLRDRDEEEIRGYQQALRWIHEQHSSIDISIETILKLHKYCKGDIWDSGKFKDKQVDITEKLPSGHERIRFKPPGVEESKIFLASAIDLWFEAIRDKKIPPLVLLVAFNLDFLSIHPFRDGNGRVSRLLLLLQLYHLGYEVGRYISIEKIIEENKERYYETLLASSQEWLQAKNDIWPYANYLFFIFKEAYKQLDDRLKSLPGSKGSKSDLIVDFINKSFGQFSVADIKYYIPGVSIDLIRRVLKDLQREQKIKSTGRGRNAQWIKIK
jgi:Fic family protein